VKRIIIVIACVIFSAGGGNAALAFDYGRIAVVDNQFDGVHKILKAYKIPFSSLKYTECEDPRTFQRFDVIFFPCGLGSALETNINILSRGTSIQSVSLKEEYYEIDTKKIIKNIRAFLRKGGVGYFSGYSCDVLDGVYRALAFFDDFPNIGLSGRVDVTLAGDLRSFAGGGRMTLSMPHSGWVALKSAGDAEVLAGGVFPTPRGQRSGPVVVRFPGDGGEALYTSYHNDDVSNAIMRFLVLRAAGRGLRAEAERMARRWDQKTETSIVDVLPSWEYCRSYSLSLKQGCATLYLKSPETYFQMDVFDDKNNIILSRHSWQKDLIQDMHIPRDGTYTLKIYPCFPARFVPYAIISASGWRLFPYWRKVTLGAFFLLVIMTLNWLYRLMNPRKYSGRPR